jgi:hypothetical protein
LRGADTPGIYDGSVDTLRHLLRTAKGLARDPSIPRWIRWLFVFGLMPIPLFFDEAALVVATGILLLFHRRTVADAWKATALKGRAS